MGESYQSNMTNAPDIKDKMVYKVLGFLVFYITLSPITIYSPSIAQVLAYICFCLIIINIKKDDIFDSRIRPARSISIGLFVLAFFIPILVHGETPFVTDLVQWISFFLLISIKNKYRVLILKYSVKILYVITIFSIIEYLIGYITGKAYFIASFQKGEISYSQTIFNLYRYGNLKYRFTSLSNEPGSLGALCGFLIAFLPLKKQYIRQILVFTLAGILSLSLAFYIYLFTILIFKTLTRNIKVKYFLASIIAISIVLFIFREAVTASIIERVSQRDDIESMDNRTGEQVNKFMKNIFNSPDAIYGVGNRMAYQLEKDSGQGNAGLKWKLFQYGIFGVGFYFIGIIILLRKRRNRNVSMIFTILFFSLYFYSVGSWGLPIFVLLMFTTIPTQEIVSKNKRIQMA